MWLMAFCGSHKAKLHPRRQSGTSKDSRHASLARRLNFLDFIRMAARSATTRTPRAATEAYPTFRVTSNQISDSAWVNG